jgi:hypothetical protein
VRGNTRREGWGEIPEERDEGKQLSLHCAEVECNLSIQDIISEKVMPKHCCSLQLPNLHTTNKRLFLIRTQKIIVRFKTQHKQYTLWSPHILMSQCCAYFYYPFPQVRNVAQK